MSYGARMATTAPPRAAPDLDQRVYLHGLRWADYEALLAMRGESARPRITYLAGTVELMSPSRPHERIKTTMARLLEAWADARDVELTGYGSWTLKEALEERGCEPDECYILGPDPETKPWPDLAIEVVWTSGGLDKLEVYRAFSVAEVWFWEDGRVRVFALVDGGYREVPASALLPEVDLALLARLAADPSQRAALKAWRAALDPGA